MDAVSGQQDSGMAAHSDPTFLWGKKPASGWFSCRCWERDFSICVMWELCVKRGDVPGCYQLQLGGSRVYSGLLAQLDGTDSCMEAKVGYLGRKKQRLDMNHVAKHMGARSQSRILASGCAAGTRLGSCFEGPLILRRELLTRRAKRGKRYCFLGEEIVNQTIPLILCGEENVRGSHGASIGRLDEGNAILSGIPGDWSGLRRRI